MGIVIDVVRVACKTSGAPTTQSIAVDFGGLTPKAVRFVVVRATVDGTPADHAAISHGATDGIRQWSVGLSDAHGLGTTDTQTAYNASAVIQIADPTAAGSSDGTAVISSLGADNVTIEWSEYPAGAYLLVVTAYGGSDLTAYADILDILNAVDNTIDITAPGFEPDALAVAANHNNFNPAIAGHGTISYGFVHNDGVGGVSQYSITTFWGDAKTASDCAFRIEDSGAIHRIFAGSLDFYVEFHTFDASGFSCSARINGGNNIEIGYLALNFGGAVSSYVGVYETPTATGSDTDAGPNFTPQYVSMIASLAEAADTVYTNGNAGGFGFCELVSNSQFANVINAEDNQSTTDTQSLSDDQAINLPNHDGAALLAATLTSFGATGPVYNWTAVAGAAKQFLVWAIEEEAEAGGNENPWYVYAQQ